MTQQDLPVLKKKRNVLFPRDKPLFSISSQHAAAASAFQLESDQAATLA